MTSRSGIVRASIHRLLSSLIASCAALAILASTASAEVGEVRLARQFGSIYLPIMVMEHQKLIEKHAAAAGRPDLKVTWAQFAGPAGMVDAILSNSIDFTAQGVPSLAVLWDKTRTGLGVKALASINESPLYLNARRSTVKSVKDFAETDRIALPSPKVSVQAIYLQMAAEKAFGPGQARGAGSSDGRDAASRCDGGAIEPAGRTYGPLHGRSLSQPRDQGRHDAGDDFGRNRRRSGIDHRAVLDREIPRGKSGRIQDRQWRVLRGDRFHRRGHEACGRHLPRDDAGQDDDRRRTRGADHRT